MDTRFWGPSGWKLLHIITFSYPDHPSKKEKEKMFHFLETIPFILPCKYCRHSLSCYYEKDPPFKSLNSRTDLTKWLWRIHNQVNNKLRSQNLNPTTNPTFASVEKFYKRLLFRVIEKKSSSDDIQTNSIFSSIPNNYTCYLTTFWNFLFAVAYNHPKQTYKDSKPMANCPESILHDSPQHNQICKSVSKLDINEKKMELERNKWNVLSYSVRMRWYTRFWYILPHVFGENLSKAWFSAQKRSNRSIENRKSTISWIWRMRCLLDKNFQDPYTQICKKIAEHSSDCSKSLRAKTCRKKRNIGRRETVKNK